ncbi:MAG TPA: DUF5666 domain-containing protein [Thermoanaerobaculia bacterium]|nr:DUF5666 domain-containing protein [Thermoanaerobaculia bacterium]
MYRASTHAVIALVLVSMLSGCRSENSVTGPPLLTTRTLAGQIVPVGDLTGSSPAGINVTSNGQVAVTDAAGQFAFMGLPAKDVQLTFTRADGISAQATVDGTAASVVVQLQKTQASVQVTGNGNGNNRGQTRELEGLILEVDDTSITVNNASTGGPVTAKITSDTFIRFGGTRLTAADLEVGDRVHVRTTTNDDGSLTALEIILQERKEDDGNGNGNGGGQTRELEGLILEVSDTSITVNNASTGGPVTAAITGDTVIRRGNTHLSASDLKVGDRVHVRTSANTDASLTALEIILQNPAR